MTWSLSSRGQKCNLFIELIKINMIDMCNYVRSLEDSISKETFFKQKPLPALYVYFFYDYQPVLIILPTSSL